MGPTARPWAAAIDNTKGEVEALKVQIGFFPRRLETEAPFCLEGYNNRIAPARAIPGGCIVAAALAAPHVGRTNDDFIARGDYH
jgi:hypothetical protein